MKVQVRNSRLRNRRQILPLRFLAEIARDQAFNDFVLDVFGETLAHDGSRNLPFAEPGNARQLLIAVHHALGLSFYHVGRNLDSYFALARIWLFRGERRPPQPVRLD